MKKLFLTLMACFAVITANAAASQLYLIGDPAGGWSPANGVAMNQTSTGVFSLTITFTGQQYFGFATTLNTNNDWNSFNANRYSPSSKDATPSLTGSNSMNFNSGDNSWVLGAGNYTFNVNTNNNTFTVTASGEVEKFYPVLYLKGSDNSWSDNQNYLFERDGDIYTLSLESLSGEFKIADSNWNNSYTFGYSSALTLDQEYTLNSPGGNMSIVDGNTWNNVTLTFNYETKVFKATGKASENDYDCIYIVGDFGASDSWDENITTFALNLKSGTDNTYEGSFAPTKGEGYFKLKAGTLVYGVNGDNDQLVESGQTYTANQGGGKAFKVVNGEYNVTFVLDKNADSGTLTVTGTASFPEALYVIGSDVNGSKDWTLQTNQMTTSGDGIYTWEGDYIMSGFKFNAGSWDGGWDIGAAGANALTPGTPLAVQNGGSDNDLTFNGFDRLNNATITLDLNTWQVTVTGTPVVEYPETLYVIGNLNGLQFTPVSTVVMTTGEDGEYSIENLAITGADEKGYGYIQFCTNTSSSDDWTEINSGTRYGAPENDTPLDCKNTVGVVASSEIVNSGEGSVSFKIEQGFYNVTVNLATMTVSITPSFNELAFGVTADDNWAQSGTVEGNNISIVVLETKETAELYITAPEGTTPFYQLGEAPAGTGVSTLALDVPGYTEVPEITVGEYEKRAVSLAKNTSGTITLCFAQEIEGNTVTSTPVTYNYSVVVDTPTGVDAIESAEGEAEYFNLQGQKVANPDKGIFIKVAGGKAVKVIL